MWVDGANKFTVNVPNLRKVLGWWVIKFGSIVPKIGFFLFLFFSGGFLIVNDEGHQITLALRVVPVSCWMSNQNPWLFGSGFKPSTAPWYFSAAFRKCGQERTGDEEVQF